MGQDYIISLAIRDKETKNNKYIINIAYWRKAFGVTNAMQDIARKPIHLISAEEDYLTISSTSVLKDVEKVIISNLNNLDNEIWTYSGVFTPIEVRNTSVHNLANILAAEEWITNPENEDAYDLMWEDNASYSPSTLEDYLKNKDKYEVVVIFENSY